MNMNNHTFPVIEIFGPTIQGEGYMAGQVTHFIRFGGCTYRCAWCDTMYAVDPKQVKLNATPVTADQIAFRLQQDPCQVSAVTLTGGDPCIHKHMNEVIEAIRGYNPHIHIIVETQGAIYQEWLSKVDLVSLSPKGPSSKMDTDWAKLDKIIRMLADKEIPTTLKIVVFTRADLEYALEVRDKYPHHPFALQIGTPMDVEERDLNTMLLAHTQATFEAIQRPPFNALLEPPGIRILPQIHTLLWGRERGR